MCLNLFTIWPFQYKTIMLFLTASPTHAIVPDTGTLNRRLLMEVPSKGDCLINTVLLEIP